MIGRCGFSIVHEFQKLYVVDSNSHGQDLPGPKGKVTVDLKKTDLELFKVWLQFKIICLKTRV